MMVAVMVMMVMVVVGSYGHFSSAVDPGIA